MSQTQNPNTSITGEKSIGFFLNSESQSWFPNGQTPDNVAVGNRPLKGLYQAAKYFHGGLAVLCGLSAVLMAPSTAPIIIKVIMGSAALSYGLQAYSAHDMDQQQRNDASQNWLYSCAETVMGPARLDGLKHDQWQGAVEGALREKLAELGFTQEDRDLLVSQDKLSSHEQARLDQTFHKVVADGGHDDLLNLLAAHRKTLNTDAEKTATPVACKSSPMA